MNIHIRFAFIYISSYLVGCGICFIKRDWVAKIYIEGSEIHTWLKPMMRIFAFIVSGSIVMSGLARLSQATVGVETTQWIYFPILAISLWPLAIAGFIYSLLSFKIARVQYKLWQKNDSQKGSMSVENT